MTKRDLYKEAGVNIDAGNEAATRYTGIAAATRRNGVFGRLGGFSGGFELDVQKYPQPILVSGTDGVGTKLKVAFATGRHDSIGIDCVAMCVNDILTSGAEPLYFLDYLAVGTLDVDVAAAIVAGVATGCMQADCALIGGETAEMPDVYQAGEYDLAGFAAGVVNKSAVIDGSTIVAGDVIIGLASNGVHSNGFSLIRKLIHAANLDWETSLPGWRGSIADELLRPTRIYVQPVRALLAAGVTIKGMAHVTGGGLADNVPRCLPAGVHAEILRDSWAMPPVFTWLLEQSGQSFEDAARIWNLGIGYVLVVSVLDAEHVMTLLSEQGETCFAIGQVARANDASAGTVVFAEVNV